MNERAEIAELLRRMADSETGERWFTLARAAELLDDCRYELTDKGRELLGGGE